MKNSIFIVNPETDNMSNALPYLYLIFKSYYREFGRHGDRWNWPLPIGNVDGFSFEDLVELIRVENPKIVGFSNYLWNYQSNLELGRAVKMALPDTILVYGGPQVQYDRPNWFKENWWVDLVATTDGNGEEFIRVLLDQVCEGGLDPDHIPLCVYPNENRDTWRKSSVTFDRKNFTWPVSLFEGNQTEVLVLKRMAEAKGARLTTIWETTRGCPYSCAYCDWGGGIGNKILRKSPEVIQEELLYMEELNIEYIEFCDANFGIFKDRDLAIVDYLIGRSRAGWDLQIGFDGKTKKDIETANLIDRKLIESGIQYDYDYHFSVSASDPISAKAVNRSMFQVQRQLDFISSVVDNGYRIRLELIMGLPESTLDSFYTEYNTLAAADGWLTERFVWILLSRSPASKPEYIEKYKIKTAQVKYPYLRAIRQNVRTEYSILHDEKYQGVFEIVVETSSYTRGEWVQMYFMDKFAGGLECCGITASLRKVCENKGIPASQFYKLCWGALNNLDGQAKKSFDLLIANIHKAIDGFSGIASFPYEGKDLILQLISPLFIANFCLEFTREIARLVPNETQIKEELVLMERFLQGIKSSQYPEKVVADLYQEFAYKKVTTKKPSKALELENH